MRYAIVQNGIVTNVIEAEPEVAAGFGAIQSDDAQIGWTWDGEAFAPPPVDFEALLAAKLAAINAKRDAVLTGGYTVQSGEMAGKVLQTRGLEDRTNWLISQGSYSAAVAAGHGAVAGARFRTADNATFTLSYADGLAVLLAMAAWGAACMDRSWTMKDAALAAEDAADLDEVDVEAGWP